MPSDEDLLATPGGDIVFLHASSAPEPAPPGAVLRPPPPVRPTPGLSAALAREVYRIATNEVHHGDGLAWLLGELLADRRDASLSTAMTRIAEALLSSPAPILRDEALGHRRPG